MKLKSILLLLSFVATNSWSQGNEFQDSNSYYVLNTIDPVENFDDLVVLDKHFNNVKVVGLGEATHGTHEFSVMRHRLFKFLVENHQFNTFFLEADYANCIRANAYIHGAQDSIESVVKELGSWPWIIREMGDLIEWMRLFNSNHPERQLSFIGVDMQRYPKTLQEIDEILAKYDLPVTTDSTLLDIPTFGIANIEEKKLKLRLLDLVKTKRNVKTNSFSPEDQRDYSNLVRHLSQMVQTKKLEKREYRDEMMAQNILHHIQNSPEIKGIFWAHNGHVTKLDSRRRSLRTGSFLDRAIGSQYFCIGQEFEFGSFNAYYKNGEETEANTKKGYSFGPVELGPAPDELFFAQYNEFGNIVFVLTDRMITSEPFILMHTIGAVYRSEGEEPYNVALFFNINSFDAILFIQESTPSLLYEKKP